MPVNREDLAQALESLAREIERPVIIGQHISVSAGVGASGTIVGQVVEVFAGPGSRGSIVGNKITVRAGGTDLTDNQADKQLATELRELASDVRQGQSPWGTIRRAIANAGKLANAALTAISRGAVEALLDRYGL